MPSSWVEVENNSVQWSQIQRRITKNELKKEGLKCFEKCASVWQSYQKQRKTENKINWSKVEAKKDFLEGEADILEDMLNKYDTFDIWKDSYET